MTFSRSASKNSLEWLAKRKFTNNNNLANNKKWRQIRQICERMNIICLARPGLNGVFYVYFVVYLIPLVNGFWVLLEHGQKEYLNYSSFTSVAAVRSLARFAYVGVSVHRFLRQFHFLCDENFALSLSLFGSVPSTHWRLCVVKSKLLDHVKLLPECITFHWQFSFSPGRIYNASRVFTGAPKQIIASTHCVAGPTHINNRPITILSAGYPLRQQQRNA